jgi:hypothetical protein
MAVLLSRQVNASVEKHVRVDPKSKCIVWTTSVEGNEDFGIDQWHVRPTFARAP